MLLATKKKIPGASLATEKVAGLMIKRRCSSDFHYSSLDSLRISLLDNDLPTLVALHDTQNKMAHIQTCILCEDPNPCISNITRSMQVTRFIGTHLTTEYTSRMNFVSIILLNTRKLCFPCTIKTASRQHGC